jgi:peroxiredoxin
MEALGDSIMKNYKWNSMGAYVVCFMILFGIFCRAEAGSDTDESLVNMKTFDGQAVAIESSKLTHLVFQEIWSSYENLGEEVRVSTLPKAFMDLSQQVWVQPGINVTEAQLTEYQGYYPQITPLVLDRGYRLMRSLGGWELPLHIILKDGKTVFSGNGDDLSIVASNHFLTETTIHQWLQTAANNFSIKAAAAVEVSRPISFSLKGAVKPRYHKPVVGEQAPVFTAKTMVGDTVSLRTLSKSKPLSLIFVDSLCPMPHFPNCEAKLEQLNDLVAKDASREWLGVVSSFYVNENVAQQFRDKFNLKLPLIFDIDNKIHQAYRVNASPYQIDISRDGYIHSRGDEIH